jgi:hypothetical protein
MTAYLGLLQQKVFSLLLGLFNSWQFFEAKPVPAMAQIMQFVILNSNTSCAT